MNQIATPLKAGTSLANTVFLMGEMTAGKDYIGEILIKRGYKRIAFADALKEEVAAKHGISVAELNANKAIYRRELQEWGASQRAKNINYWVERFDEKLHNHNGLVVCTDTRHLNEATYAVSNVDNGVIVRIWTPWEVRKERIKALYGEIPADYHNHPSETEVAMCPFNIRISGVLNNPEMIERELQATYAHWVGVGKPIYKEVLNIKMR